MELFTLGVDLGKTTFHLVGMNRGGEVVITWFVSARSGIRFRNMNEEVGNPCRRTIVGASFLPASR
jgi:hypothetical protein